MEQNITEPHHGTNVYWNTVWQEQNNDQKQAWRRWRWQMKPQDVQSSSQIIAANKPASSFLQAGWLPVIQPTVSKYWREKYHILQNCSPQAHLGSSYPVSDLLVSLGEGCQVSRQPSDASTPFYGFIEVHLKIIWDTSVNICRQMLLRVQCCKEDHDNDKHQYKQRQYESA